MRQTFTYLPDDVHTQLTELAAREGRSVSATVAWVLKLYLQGEAGR